MLKLLCTEYVLVRFFTPVLSRENTCTSPPSQNPASSTGYKCASSLTTARYDVRLSIIPVTVKPPALPQWSCCFERSTSNVRTAGDPVMQTRIRIRVCTSLVLGLYIHRKVQVQVASSCHMKHLSTVGLQSTVIVGYAQDSLSDIDLLRSSTSRRIIHFY